MFPGGFTVLMAVYERNDPALFERAVASVYENTVPPDDFVLVVDGPTPPPLDAAIERWTAQRGIRTVRLPCNLGLAKALNHGLSLIRTAWVVRADADDVNVPYRFERQAEAIQRMASQVDLVGGAIVEVDRSGAPIGIREVPLSHAEIVDRIRTRNPFNHMTVAYRTSTAVKAGGYPDIHLKEDYALWAAMIADGARCANVSEILVRATAGRDLYRRRGGLRYARSEWVLQLHLFRHGLQSLLSVALLGFLRSSVAVLPARVRGWIYERLLRTRIS